MLTKSQSCTAIAGKAHDLSWQIPIITVFNISGIFIGLTINVVLQLSVYPKLEIFLITIYWLKSKNKIFYHFI